MKADLIRQVAFPEADEARWRALALKALKGEDFDAALVSTTADGIRFGPIAGREKDGVLHARQTPERPWIISQRVDDDDAARAAEQAAADLSGGATGLTLCLAGAPAAHGFGITDIGAFLAGSAGAPFRELRVEAAFASVGSVLAALPALSSSTAETRHLGLDPAAAGTDRNALSEAAAKLRGAGVIGTLWRADGRVAHNAGATEAQELAVALAGVVAALRLEEEAGTDIATAFAAVEIALSADQDQFLTTAKLRAMRQLHARLALACGLDTPRPARIHAETSWRMLSRLDPETNILRNTIAVFAAGTGGANSIAVLPHTLAHGLPDRFARRIARNTQTVLVDESHLAFVVDPAAGAGGIEELTEALAEKAWGIFQTIEREGGLAESLRTGAIQGRIAAARHALLADVESGHRVVLGTTLHPMKQERPVSVLKPRADGGAQGMLAPISLHEAHRKGEAA